MLRIACTNISRVKVSGSVLASSISLSFYGGTDPLTGNIIQRGHPLEGMNLRGKILVMPSATGSTVGNWALYRLSVHKNAPAAIILSSPDSVTVTGCIMGNIPLIVVSSVESLQNADSLEITETEIIVYSSDINVSGQQSSATESIVVIKAGGSLITDKESPVPVFNREQTAMLAHQIRESGVKCILVHGAGSYGHSPVKSLNLLSEPDSPQNRAGWSKVISLQYELNNLVCEVLRSEGLFPWPIQPDAFFSFDENMVVLNSGRNILNLVEKGYTPVFYGVPCIFGSRTGILSGDDSACHIAGICGIKKIIHFTKNDGVTDPLTKKPVEVITPANWPDLESRLKDSIIKDATGGIIKKINSLIEATSSGITGLICDGRNPEKIAEALAGKSTYTIISRPLAE